MMQCRSNNTGNLGLPDPRVEVSTGLWSELLRTNAIDSPRISLDSALGLRFWM